jgi:GWxTD domain-containing protein
MRRILLLVFIFSLHSLFSSDIKALDISVTSASFHSKDKIYLEVYIYVVGSSAHFDTLENGNLKASIDCILTIESNGQIINFDKFTLNSPESETIKDFMTLKRFSISNGSYQIKLEANDTGDKNKQFSSTNNVQINYLASAIQLSDLQLLSSISESTNEGEFNKSGYFLETAAFNFFNKDIDLLSVYLEVYNPSEDLYKAAYLRYAIYQKKTGSENSIVLQKFKKLEAKLIQPVILRVPIKEIVSGNYELIVEIRNKDKMLVDVKTISFQRSNPVLDLMVKMENQKEGFEYSFVSKMDDETARYSLKAILPLCKGDQSSTLEEIFLSGDLNAKRYFLYNFFYERSPVDPFFAYEQFMQVANAVDKSFRSNVGYGFETDRGRIFLKYGKPIETVEVEDEPSAPPYEIWFYDRLEESKQYNVKFIFYNPSLAINDYILLHSNCNGERYNPRWEVELYSNAPGGQVGNNAASTEMQQNYRRNARRIWEEL